MLLEEMKLVVVPRVATLTVAEATGTSIVCDIISYESNDSSCKLGHYAYLDTITDVDTTPH